MVKNLPAMQEIQINSLGQEDPLEKGITTHSNILTWRILWTEEPGGYSPWGRKESDTTERLTHTQSLLYFFCSFSAYLILASFGTGGVVS